MSIKIQFATASSQQQQLIAELECQNEHDAMQLLPMHLRASMEALAQDVAQEEDAQLKNDLIECLFDDFPAQQQEYHEQALACLQEVDFGTCFWSLFSDSESARHHLLRIEQQMNVQYRDTLAKRDEEQEKLRKSQAVEMEDASQKLDSDISHFVQKHLKQMEQLETKWNKTLEDEKRTQILRFQKFVKDLYMNHREDDMDQPLQEDKFIQTADQLELVPEESEYVNIPIVEKATGKEDKSKQTRYLSSLMQFFNSNEVASKQKKKEKAMSPDADWVDVTNDKGLQTVLPHLGMHMVELLEKYAFQFFQVKISALATKTSEYVRKKELDPEVDRTVNFVIVHTNKMAELLTRFDIANQEHELQQRIRAMTDLFSNNMNALIVTCQPVFDSQKLEKWSWFSPDVPSMS